MLSDTEKSLLEKIFGKKYSDLVKIKKSDWAELSKQFHPDKIGGYELSSTINSFLNEFKRKSRSLHTF